MTTKNARIAIYITKPQHLDLLRSVATQLGTTSLKDGLEHVLNCYLTGNAPIVGSVSSSPKSTAIDIDEFDGLISFED